MKLAVALSSATLALCSFGTTDACAAERGRTVVSHPANYCQAALPAFEGNLRKRPLAIQNEGVSDAFVSCSFPAQLDGGMGSLGIVVANSDTAGGLLTCTGVGGVQHENVQFVVRSVQLGAGETHMLEWEADAFESGFFPRPFSVSCNLKPGMALLDSYIQMSEEIGE